MLSLSSNATASNKKCKGVSTRIVWKINHFSLLFEILQSANFETTGPSGDKQIWHLRMLPRGDALSAKGEFVSIFIYCVGGDKPEVLAKVAFSIMDAEGKRAHIKRLDPYKFQRAGYGWGIRHFIKRDYVLAEASGMLPGGRLTIQCDVRVYDENKIPIDAIQIPECRLIQDMANLWKKELHTDCVLAIPGAEKEFRVHKGILASRSPVFAAMFEHGTTEAKNNSVLIPDIDADVLEQTLEFIYTDAAPQLEKMAVGLLSASDKYQIERLKLLCEQSLALSLDEHNACALFVLADRHAAGHLKSEALKFITSNADEVIESDGWKMLTREHIQLLVPICEALANEKRKMLFI